MRIFNFISSLIKNKYFERNLKNVKSYLDLPDKVLKRSKVVFVLSTGRCGTKLLYEIMKQHSLVDAYHEAFPYLIYASKIAYEAYKKCMPLDFGKFAIISSRYEVIQKSYIRSKLYFESNNRITFFAPYIAEIFPQVKFIHLVRHPGDFVRSGIRRAYYTGKNPWDEGRICPIDNSVDWKGMTIIEKIAWLWNETNEFIENFKNNFDKNRILFIKSEDLFTTIGIIDEICSFLEIPSLSKKKIIKILKKPVNKQKYGYFPKYKYWSYSQKKELRKYALLAEKYGYEV